jgi:hypothetical protein
MATMTQGVSGIGAAGVEDGGGGGGGRGRDSSWCGGGCRLSSVVDDFEICRSSNPVATSYSLFL